uniref:Retrotransposon gag domain-containing protein n=1 Tax=Nicotiana tabacum TaxID=4097 RepID=A0A1S4DGM1_TOBAC|nr:PREDICTED: uncharacterized protein LOC107829583 [Nicotiana tabacum]
MEDIFKVKQGDTELLRKFVDRFQCERMMLPRVPNNWEAMAFASNLNEKISEATERLKESLREFPTTTWNDVYNMYSTKLRIEEDIVAQSKVDERTGSRWLESEKRSGKNSYEPYMVPSGRDARSKLENVRSDHRLRNRDSGSSSSRIRKDRDVRDGDTNANARIGDYCFNISTSELVAVLRSIRDKGYLTDLFSEKGKQSYMKNRQEPPKPPSPKRTANVISRGEEVNGVTYTAAKKTTKFTVTHEKRVRQTLEEDSITFDDVDADGSSVNIILLRVVNEMQIGDQMIPKAHSLSGFNNSTVITKGEIMLTTFAEGVIKETKFQIIDTDMAYNVILGRPWIHDMDDVPSTLHQSHKESIDTNEDFMEDVLNQISSEYVSKQTDMDSRPDVIQEPEENENTKTTIEELEAVVLFEQWLDRKVYIGAKLSP